jgi:hypothetical protein
MDKKVLKMAVWWVEAMALVMVAMMDSGSMLETY